jgi:hypothetical protein
VGLTVSTVVAFIALLIAVSATYNAYMLRGGRLAWSQVLMVMGMIVLIFSLVLGQVMPDIVLFGDLTLTNLLFVLGFVLLLSASLKLRHAFK